MTDGNQELQQLREFATSKFAEAMQIADAFNKLGVVARAFLQEPFSPRAKANLQRVLREAEGVVPTPTIATEVEAYQLWHKIAGALVQKYGEQRLGTLDFAPLEGQAVVLSHADDGRTMVLRVMPQAEADRAAAAFQDSSRRTG